MAAPGRQALAEFCEHCRPKAIELVGWMREFLDALDEVLDREQEQDELTTTPEDTLREAGISTKRQARYQRRMSSLLAGRE